jgi:hypothetical protein
VKRAAEPAEVLREEIEDLLRAAARAGLDADEAAELVRASARRRRS